MISRRGRSFQCSSPDLKARKQVLPFLVSVLKKPYDTSSSGGGLGVIPAVTGENPSSKGEGVSR